MRSFVDLSGFSKWLDSWWSFDSFGPDIIVGVVTGVVVGIVVLGFEKRVSKRARSREISTAHAVVVERARSLLQHPLVFRHGETPSLHVDPSQLERLREIVRAVPPGDPDENIPGYHWASRAVDSFEALESLADALDARIVEYQNMGGAVMHLGLRVRGNIVTLARTWPVPHDWSFEWHDDVPKTYRSRVEEDVDLRGAIDQYLRTRRLLEAHREAFLGTDARWRELAWTALVAKTRGAPRFFVTRWWRDRKYRRATQDAMNEAEQYGYEFVTAVDNMAY